MKFKLLLIIFIFCRVGFTFAEVNREAWEQGLASLAKNVNINSLKSKPALVDKLQQMPERYSVNDIKAIIKDYRLNLDICDNIQSLADKYKNFSSENNAKRYLSEDIFTHQLQSFAAKRLPEEMEELKKAVKEDLDKIPDWEKSNKNESEEPAGENQRENTSEVVIINPPENISPNNDPQNVISLQDHENGLFEQISFQLNITSLILLFVVAYLLWVFLKKEINKQYRKTKQNPEFLDEANVNQVTLKKLEDQINELSFQLKALDVKQSKSDLEIPDVQPYPAEVSQKKQIEDLAEFQIREIEEPQKQPEETLESLPKKVEEPLDPVMQTYYLAIPNYAGVFQVYHKEYQYEKSIYLMKTSDEKTGTFSVLENRDSCAMALSAPNLFLLPACSVVGDHRPSDEIHQSIITENEGTVTKEGNYWKVSEKAIIRCE